MLNRRILRIKAFKQLYACAEDSGKSLKEALAELEDSFEAARDLYLTMLAVIPPLTSEAARRIEAARSKFNPTEEDLHPNMKFACNRLSALLEQDPDFQKIIEKKKISWDQNDVFLHELYDSIRCKDWFISYLNNPEVSLDGDVRLFKKIFEEEFEDSEALSAILEDRSILWSDDLGYVLLFIIRDLDKIRREKRWDLPPLFNSEILSRQGKVVDSDKAFVTRLFTTAYGNFKSYCDRVSASVSAWESDRLFTTDLVLISMGLAEAEAFPEIPLRVTINEYVEISKFYSTPKSASFVNGLLDRLIRSLAEEGKINKIQ
ncbi:MAG: hypothetical protein II763_01550 [Bacteroidales bacterium]|nr:hypothetical protein [Bacteroidales bacterium]